MPRKEKKFHFIYKTTNNLSGKYYIGMHSTDNLEDGYLGSGKRLRYSINKYGEENHSREILEFLDSRKELKRREEEIVNLNEIAKVECMNLKVGGDGGFSIEDATKGGYAFANRLKNDESLREKHSKTASITIKKTLSKKWKDPNYRNATLSQINWTGRSHSIETRKKMSESSNNKGSNNSQYGTCWIYKDYVNKKIKKIDLDSYIELGWNRGRKI